MAPLSRTRLARLGAVAASASALLAVGAPLAHAGDQSSVTTKIEVGGDRAWTFGGTYTCESSGTPLSFTFLLAPDGMLPHGTVNCDGHAHKFGFGPDTKPFSVEPKAKELDPKVKEKVAGQLEWLRRLEQMADEVLESVTDL